MRSVPPCPTAAAADALVMAAAVADFTPASRRTGRSPEPTASRSSSPPPRICSRRSRRPPPAGRDETAPILVGFAAETGGLDRAPAKLRSKGIDLLVANDVSEPGSGFGTDTNRVTILDRAGAVDALPLLSKREVADRILDRVARALDSRDAAAQTAGENATRAQEGRPA